MMKPDRRVVSWYLVRENSIRMRLFRTLIPVSKAVFAAIPANQGTEYCNGGCYEKKGNDNDKS